MGRLITFALHFHILGAIPAIRNLALGFWGADIRHHNTLSLLPSYLFPPCIEKETKSAGRA